MTLGLLRLGHRQPIIGRVHEKGRDTRQRQVGRPYLADSTRTSREVKKGQPESSYIGLRGIHR
jgi:hypothetical protein